MGNFLNQIIAGLLANFKAKNPQVFAAIALVLGAIIYFAEQGTLLGVFELNETWSQVVTVAGTVLGFLIGTPTTAYLPKEQREALIQKSKQVASEIDSAGN